MPTNNEKIMRVVRDLLLQEPKFQYPDQSAQFIWRAWEKLLGKEFYTITQEGFVNLFVKVSSPETLLRARRKILQEEIKNQKADEQRHKMAEEYREFFKK